MYETIDLLQQTTDYYYIDYIPYNTDDPNFLELEEYFEKHYLSSFSEKITKIREYPKVCVNLQTDVR